MMDIPYIHTCTISRITDIVNEKGSYQREVIYEGSCDYQQTGDSGIVNGMLLESPKVYIPTLDYMIKQNDEITILLEDGRQIKGLIIQTDKKDLKLLFGDRFEGKGCTEIWLENVS